MARIETTVESLDCDPWVEATEDDTYDAANMQLDSYVENLITELRALQVTNTYTKGSK